MGSTVMVGVKIRLSNLKHATRVGTKSREKRNRKKLTVNKVCRPLKPTRKRAIRRTRDIIPETRTGKKQNQTYSLPHSLPLASGC